jgi:uncharacterized protein YidB (DUF937 family)
MIEQILVDPKELVFIQSRVETNLDLVNEYATLMQDGVQFDAAQGVRDETGAVFIHDGLHRGEAAKLAGICLLVELQAGTRQDAEWLALAANQKHGLRRSTADKQRVVQQALLHPYGVNLSNSELARHCGVDDKTVARIRRELEASSEIPRIVNRLVKRNGVVYQQNTRNIRCVRNKKPVAEPEPHKPPISHVNNNAIGSNHSRTFDNISQ